FDRLVSRGLLERVPDPEDRRGVLVRSTPALQELISRLKTAMENELRDIFGTLPGEYSRRLLVDLQALQEYLDQKERKEHGR
ncbi:MAG: winged helix DNA-binding protein, partial [Candidatus Aminicenantes bacterium]|nr:winged helix DNA-binding protein [Moorella sp. (in: firmicutes)]MBC7350684.1 winged helix DNA-binding protein [Candidatus Aminicenantes bacterium]